MIPDILELLRARDFEPFLVVTSDGDRHLVRSRDHAFVLPQRQRVIVTDDNERWVVLRDFHISQVRRATQEDVRAAGGTAAAL